MDFKSRLGVDFLLDMALVDMQNVNETPASIVMPKRVYDDLAWGLRHFFKLDIFQVPKIEEWRGIPVVIDDDATVESVWDNTKNILFLDERGKKIAAIEDIKLRFDDCTQIQTSTREELDARYDSAFIPNKEGD